MTKEKDQDRVFTMHDAGCTVTEIAEALHLDEIQVKRIIIRRWDKMSKHESLARKVATRHGQTT